MELPMNVLVIILLGVIVVIAVVVGIIVPASSGANTASQRAEFTLTCNEWAAKKCSEEYFDANKDRIEKVANCQGYELCKGKCSSSGLC